VREGLDEALCALKGTSCADFTGGGMHESVLFLDLVASSGRLPACARILLFNCMWRISKSPVLVTSAMDVGEDGSIATGARSLIGLRVVRAWLEGPVHDLRVEFEGGMMLETFCDGMAPSGVLNYAVEIGSREWTIRNGIITE
jgi:hypothetical protein